MGISIEQRVANGIDLLDRHSPTWVRRVTRPIDIQSLEHCILGQIFGGWTNGTIELEIEGDQEAQEFYGFEMTHDEYTSESVDLIAGQIEAEWHSQIVIRMGL